MKIARYAKAIIPAAVLAALVLLVFYRLQFYGPESAVRQFHEAIANSNPGKLVDVTIAPASKRQLDEISWMYSQLEPRLSNGYVIRLREVDREQNEVDVTVYYYYPDGTPFGNATFVTSRTVSGWKVNVHKTLRLWNSVT